MAYTILVVDDEPDIRETIRGRLIREGYEAVTAADGDEALVRFEQVKPDIVLLDLMMPRRNGFAVLHEIRSKYTDKWRPVIIISAKDDLESTKQCYKMEADHYLPKPCTMEQVLQGIKTMISLMPHRLT